MPNYRGWSPLFSRLKKLETKKRKNEAMRVIQKLQCLLRKLEERERGCRERGNGRNSDGGGGGGGNWGWRSRIVASALT